MSRYFVEEDTLIDILSRLPLKSLRRFRTVSKSWNSLIISPIFVNVHLKRIDHSLLLTDHSSSTASRLIQKGTVPFYSLHLDDESLTEYIRLYLPYETHNQSFTLLGSCQGVVCLREDFFREDIILWNPLIKKTVEIPPSGLSCDSDMLIHGFGFDFKNNDYKIVKIMNVRSSTVTGCKTRGRPKVQLYSLNAGSWKSISAGLDSFCAFPFRGHAFVNGVFHWIASREVNGEAMNFVLSFDLSNELFREMTLPENLATHNPGFIWILEFENSLALFQYDVEGTYVWIMKEYGVNESWSHEFIISETIISRRKEIGWPLAFRENGELLMSTHVQLYSLDLQSQESDIFKNFMSKNLSYASPYIPSQILLKEDDRKRMSDMTQRQARRRNKGFQAPRKGRN